MDDFTINSLQESRNEWTSRLIYILTPLILDGCKIICKEAIKVCKKNNENEKYLITFQQFLSHVPKWNSHMIDEECKRIIEKSNCTYLGDLIMCVHIIHLKMLTVMRVGTKQKKMDLDIVPFSTFIHNVYVHCARKMYTNCYLFEQGIPPLQMQKNNRKLELLVQECILTTIRDSIPVEIVLRAYLDETEEDHTSEVIKEEQIIVPLTKEEQAIELEKKQQALLNQSQMPMSLTFNDKDYIALNDGNTLTIDAPKDIPRLEQISVLRNEQRKQEELAEELSDNDGEKIKILSDNAPLVLDVDTLPINFDEDKTEDKDKIDLTLKIKPKELLMDVEEL